MSETNFEDIGKVEAIERLFEGTPYKPFESLVWEASSREYIANASRVFLEGTDFNLVYFPLKHLGYKCVVAVTGELYAQMAHPVSLSVVLGVSSKLGYDQVAEIWGGIVSACREHGYKQVSLDLVPSRNGLTVSVSAAGELALLTAKRRQAPRSRDLLCVSGPLGAAYLGQQVLERECARFEGGEHAGREETLEHYKMLVGAYLKPELSPQTVSQLESAEIIPSAACLVRNGLADAVKQLVRSTGLGAKVYAETIPFEGDSFDLGQELGIDTVSAAMNGGDDFRLLLVVPILRMEQFRRDFQTFDIIGHLAQPEVGAVLVTPDGVELPLRAQGWKEE